MSDQPITYGANGPWILTLDVEQRKHVEALVRAGQNLVYELDAALKRVKELEAQVAAGAPRMEIS